MGVKRPALLIGGVILAAVLGTAGAWLSWPRQASSPRSANATQTKPAPALAAIPVKPEAKPAAPIVIPEAAAPPEPTSAEFARAAVAPGPPPPPGPARRRFGARRGGAGPGDAGTPRARAPRRHAARCGRLGCPAD